MLQEAFIFFYDRCAFGIRNKINTKFSTTSLGVIQRGRCVTIYTLLATTSRDTNFYGPWH